MLGGKTLSAGLYKWSTNVSIDGTNGTDDLTLSGNSNDVWIFQIAQDFTMAAGRQIVLYQPFSQRSSMSGACHYRKARSKTRALRQQFIDFGGGRQCEYLESLRMSSDHVERAGTDGAG